MTDLETGNLNEELEDLFKNQSDLQKQIKSSIMEFNGFSFCREKENQEEPMSYSQKTQTNKMTFEDQKFIEKNTNNFLKEETERSLNINRFTENKNQEVQGLSFRKQEDSKEFFEDEPTQKVYKLTLRILLKRREDEKLKTKMKWKLIQIILMILRRKTIRMCISKPTRIR
jgi:hypothetical protein